MSRAGIRRALVEVGVAAGVSLASAAAFVLATWALRGGEWFIPLSEWWHEPRDLRLVASAAIWSTAGLAASSLVGLASRRVAGGGPMVPAACWVLGCLSVASPLGWQLSPMRHTFLDLGPAIAAWLLAGTLVLLVVRRRSAGGPRGWWTVPYRALITWGLAYGTLWLFVAALSLRLLPETVFAGIAVLLLVWMIGVLAFATAFVGPPEPGPQLAAVGPAGIGLFLGSPGSDQQVSAIVSFVASPSAAHIGSLVPAFVVGALVALSFLLCAVAGWFRSRSWRRAQAET